MKIPGLTICVIACGLLSASCAPESGGARTTPEATSGPLPNRLTPGDIRRAVGRIMGRARGCGHRYRVVGTHRVRVQILGATGLPIRVTVINSPTHQPTSQCVINAFRRARFRRFRNRTQSFIFPLIFR